MDLNSEANGPIEWRNAVDALHYGQRWNSAALLSANRRAIAASKEALGKAVRRFRTAGGICCERAP